MKKLIVAVLLLAFVACACTQERNKQNIEEVWNAGAILKVGSEQIDSSEGLVYLDAAARDYELYYGSEIWDYKVDAEGGEIRDIIKDEVMGSIIRIKLVCSRANELNVYLSEEELKKVDEETAEYMEKIAGSSVLQKGVNENVVRRVYIDNRIARKVYEKVSENEAFEEAYARWEETTEIKVNHSVWDELDTFASSGK